MEEPIYGGLIDKYYFYQIGIILLILIGAIIIIMIMGRNLANRYDYPSSFCDYDSCSQESDSWRINGSRCFDVNNSECKDFLRLWEVCQSHKRRIGSC